MMDYYSTFPMPSIEERVKDLLIYAKTLNSKFNENELECIVTKIASETEVFSLTGYSVFGVNKEKNKILNYLTSK